MSFRHGPWIATTLLLAALARGPLGAASVEPTPSGDSRSAQLPVLLSLVSPSADDAARLLPDLTRMTGDDDPLVRAAAAAAVGKLGAAVAPGPMTVTAVEALASLLHAKAPDVQVVAAAGALARIGAPSVYLASYIANRLDEGRPLAANVACLDALTRLAADMPDNVDSYWIVRQVIWSALRDRGPERNQFLAAAIEQLSVFGKTPAAALADMMSRNQTPDVYTRRRLFSILKRLSPEMREPATRMLHQIARDPADALRLDALCELVALGADDAYVRAQLLRIGGATDPDVSPMDRERALDAFALRRPDEQVLRELVTGLEDDATGDVAGELLVRYGPAARTAIGGLADRIASTRSIAVKRRMVSLLGSLGPGARDAVPVIAPLVKGGYQSLRLAAMIALAEIGPDAKSAVAQLLPLLRESSPVIRGSAAYALVRIAPEDERLAAELVRAARSNDWMLCVVLSPALRAVRGAGDPTADLATVARRDPNAEIRAVAYYALRDMGVSLPWLYPERRAGE